MNFLETVSDLVLPERCLLCARPLLGCRSGKFALCRGCCGALQPLGEPRCRLCGAPLLSEHELCLDCRERSHRFIVHRSAFAYDRNVAELLHGFKADGARTLARLFAGALVTLYAQYCDGAVLVPVPGHPAATWRRGWDQAHELCRAMRCDCGAEIFSALRRGRTRRQKELGFAERQQNLKGHVRLALNPIRLRGRNVALIDDVYTTGATVDACCEALSRAEVGEIYAFTVAMDL